MSRPYYTRLEDGVGYLLNDLLRGTDETTWAILTANELKAVYNVHLASTDYHTAADAVNTITSADATDLASLIVLLNEARGDYEAHRVLVGVGPVHGSADATHAITAPVCVDLATAVTLLKDLARQYQRHKYDVGGSPAIHLAEDDDRFFWQYVNKIAHFGGRIDDVLAVKKKATAGAPMILVQAQGSDPEKIDVGGSYYRNSKVSLLLIDKSKRTEGPDSPGEVQRRGSDIALEPPGLYQMIEDVCDRLVGKQPVDGFGTSIPGMQWRIVEERDAYGDNDIQIWVLSFVSRVSHTWAQIDRSTLDDFLRADGEGNSMDPVRGDYLALQVTLNTWP